MPDFMLKQQQASRKIFIKINFVGKSCCKSQVKFLEGSVQEPLLKGKPALHSRSFNSSIGRPMILE